MRNTYVLFWLCHAQSGAKATHLPRLGPPLRHSKFFLPAHHHAIYLLSPQAAILPHLSMRGRSCQEEEASRDNRAHGARCQRSMEHGSVRTRGDLDGDVGQRRTTTSNWPVFTPSRSRVLQAARSGGGNLRILRSYFRLLAVLQQEFERPGRFLGSCAWLCPCPCPPMGLLRAAEQRRPPAHAQQGRRTVAAAAARERAPSAAQGQEAGAVRVQVRLQGPVHRPHRVVLRW
jgi:hypothetical protein